MFKKQEIPVNPEQQIRQLEAAVKQALAERDDYKKRLDHNEEVIVYLRAERERYQQRYIQQVDKYNRVREERDRVVNDMIRMQGGAQQLRVGGDEDDQLFREGGLNVPRPAARGPRVNPQAPAFQRGYGDAQAMRHLDPEPDVDPAPHHAPKPKLQDYINAARMGAIQGGEYGAHMQYIEAAQMWADREQRHQQEFRRRVMRERIQPMQVNAAVPEPVAPLAERPRGQDIMWFVEDGDQAQHNAVPAPAPVDLNPADDDDDYDPGEDPGDYEQPEL